MYVKYSNAKTITCHPTRATYNSPKYPNSLSDPVFHQTISSSTAKFLLQAECNSAKSEILKFNGHSHKRFDDELLLVRMGTGKSAEQEKTGKENQNVAGTSVPPALSSPRAQ